MSRRVARAPAFNGSLREFEDAWVPWHFSRSGSGDLRQKGPQRIREHGTPLLAVFPASCDDQNPERLPST
eukprot:CAMPEP_0185771814 /NCGR_PEP_ID=MMETSP1174-20130828/65277_1 /TAXON_ID=35687 /ORGANISM="Dictyocha speculum, Strain CCMP1381" /LENGTH=69 /DNA_ID=CAMNT_0028457789 /DNA_START=405 /DNA_END=614 /DNA_ORIENTATION=+